MAGSLLSHPGHRILQCNSILSGYVKDEVTAYKLILFRHCTAKNHGQLSTCSMLLKIENRVKQCFAANIVHGCSGLNNIRTPDSGSTMLFQYFG